MTKTYEEEIADKAKEWLEAQKRYQAAESARERAQREWQEAYDARNRLATDLQGCVGRNVPLRLILIDGDAVIVELDHGIRLVEPIRPARPS